MRQARAMEMPEERKARLLQLKLFSSTVLSLILSLQILPSLLLLQPQTNNVYTHYPCTNVLLHSTSTQLARSRLRMQLVYI